MPPKWRIIGLGWQNCKHRQKSFLTAGCLKGEKFNLPITKLVMLFLNKTLKEMTTIEFTNKLLDMQSKLRCYAYHLTANKENAADLLQETTLKVLSNKDKFEEHSNFSSWVYTIMKNTFINNYRHTVKSNEIFNKNEIPQNLIPASRDMSQEATRSMEEIINKVERLEDDYRQPFKLYTEGFKYKEIADKLNIPIGTVKSKIFFARQKLINALPEYWGEYYGKNVQYA